MMNLKKNHSILDSAGLISIGIFSLGYIIFVRPFAELYIQLPFLNFPIFIGEILLLLCLCLFLLKGDLTLDKKHYWIIGYFIFVIFKALHGYMTFGPLALRNAALFYYPVFIIFSISFYRRAFFDPIKNGLIIAVILLMFVSRSCDGYWLLTCFSLGLILSCTYPVKKIRYLLLGALIVTMPYGPFFATSRMMMLANFLTGIYLIVGLYAISRIKRIYKAIIAVSSIVLIVCMFLTFSDRNALLAIIRADKVIATFQERDRQFKDIHAKIIPPIPGTYLADDYTPNNIKQPQIFNSDIMKQYEKLNERELAGIVRSVGQKEIGDLQGGDSGLLVPAMGLSDSSVTKMKTETTNQGKKELVTAPPRRNIQAAYENAVFRLFIWRDMLAELKREKPIFGFSFGRPLRSITLETLRWGEGDWKRDGWIGAHNSFLDVIYRAGIVGLFAIGYVLFILFHMIKKSIQCKSITGILLCGVIINWFIAANFLLIFELPFTAIPIWTLFGLTYAYVGENEARLQKDKCQIS